MVDGTRLDQLALDIRERCADQPRHTLAGRRARHAASDRDSCDRLGDVRGAGPRQQLRRQHRRVDQLAVVEDDDLADDVVQLADVAGPDAADQASAARRRSKPGRTRPPPRRTRAGSPASHDVLGPRPQRRHVDGEHVQPVEQVVAEAAGLDPSARVAVGCARRAGHRPRFSRAPPTRLDGRRSGRSAAAWSAAPRSISQISSRKSVPPWATRPRQPVLSAPVKAPFGWPKISLSIRSARDGGCS